MKHRKYQCVCGYVYDPDVGEPDRSIEPGTPFPDLPEGYRCPKCGASKKMFAPYPNPRAG
jgi:rubredoxin